MHSFTFFILIVALVKEQSKDMNKSIFRSIIPSHLPHIGWQLMNNHGPHLRGLNGIFYKKDINLNLFTFMYSIYSPRLKSFTENRPSLFRISFLWAFNSMSVFCCFFLLLVISTPSAMSSLISFSLFLISSSCAICSAHSALNRWKWWLLFINSATSPFTPDFHSILGSPCLPSF